MPAVQPAAKEVTRRSGDSLPLAAYLVFLAFILPVSFNVGSLELSISRTLLLILTPILFVRLLSGSAGPIRTPDVLILLFMLCFAVSIFLYNRAAFVTFVGSQMVILLGAYLTGRVLIRGPKAFLQYIKLYGVACLVLLPLALYESLTSRMIVVELINSLPGVSSAYQSDTSPRLGLERAQVVFDHPIHYGLFNTLAFGLIFIGLRGRISNAKRWLWAGLAGAGCFLGLSSGPLVGILAQVSLLVFAVIFRTVRNRWWMLVGFSGVGYILLDLVSSRPAYYAVVERLAMSSQSAFLRRLILEYGVEQIKRKPLFGIGYNSFPLPSFMTGSLDNYWLMVAITHGLPALLFLLGAHFYILIVGGRRDLGGDPGQENLRMAWAIATVGIMVSLATVAVWSDMASIIFMSLGSGVWLVGARASRPVDQAEPLPETRHQSRFTRFPNHDRGVTAFTQNRHI